MMSPSTRSPKTVEPMPPADPGDADPWVGRRLGKYLLVRPLGRGGMGAVYEARDEMLDRRVAVKLLADAAGHGTAATPPGTDSSGSRRLLAEARRAARLNHPNVVTVHEVDAFEGGYFLVMELIDGRSAQDALAAGGAMPWRQATLVMVEACRGLAAAHRAGLVHRDIKPANLLIARGGTCKLADFGVAKAAFDSGSQTGGLGLTTTAAGVAVGTPTYMSPEQCRSEEVDERSDVYSLGATFYALLTGRPPYVAESAVQVMFAHCGNPIPDPRQVNPNVPEACAAVVRRAMAKRRTDRYESAEAMLRDLEAAVVGGKTVAGPAIPPTTAVGAVGPDAVTTVARAADPDWPPVPIGPVAAAARATADEPEARGTGAAATASDGRAPGPAFGETARRHRVLVASAAAALLIAGAVWAVVLIAGGDGGAARSGPGGKPAAAAAIPAAVPRPLAAPSRPAAVPPATAAARPAGRLAIRERLRVTVPNPAQCVRLTGDGTRLAVATAHDGTVRVFDTHTRGLLRQQVTQAGTVAAVAFSPDGRYLASAGTHDHRVRVCDTPATHVESGSWLLVGTVNAEPVELLSLAFASDGGTLYVGTSGDLRAYPFVGGRLEDRPRFVIPNLYMVRALALSPDGARLAYGQWDKRLVHVVAARDGAPVADPPPGTTRSTPSPPPTTCRPRPTGPGSPSGGGACSTGSGRASRCTSGGRRATASIRPCGWRPTIRTPTRPRSRTGCRRRRASQSPPRRTASSSAGAAGSSRRS